MCRHQATQAEGELSELHRGLGYFLASAAIRTAAKMGGLPSPVADSLAASPALVGPALDGGSPFVSAVGVGAGIAAAELVDGFFTTKRRLLFWADSHGDAYTRQGIIRAMAMEPGVDAAIFGGDAEGWDDWQHDVRPLADRCKVLAVPGNHDSREELEAALGVTYPFGFELAGWWIWLLADPPTAKQVKAVLRGIRMAGASKVIVVVHRSPIAFSEESAPGVPQVAETLAPLLDRGCVVLCGHHHVYGWGVIGKSNVISAGIGGSKHYTCRCEPPCAECDSEVRGYLRVDLGGKINVQLRRVE
jgi:hypothetical protein